MFVLLDDTLQNHVLNSYVCILREYFTFVFLTFVFFFHNSLTFILNAHVNIFLLLLV
jgi:hypothetical protein